VQKGSSEHHVSNNGQPVVLNDRYELEQRIGRGGMADVFLARDQLLNRQVAIKVLFPEFAVDPNFVERFRREAQSAANLNHPNIVGVYDWGKYSNTYFMAMEYVRGRTLADILKTNGHINSIQAAEIASEIAAALGHAHRNGVVHRDIKPANVLIGANGQVKVADFGIARAMNAPTESNLTQVGNVMGTATYFSPEQAQGAQPDPRSDLYSVGVVLYEMVAGQPPFTGDNPVSIAYKQVHDAPTPLNQLVADVPRPYEAIVAKLLAKQPDQRYPSAEALRDDLRRFRNGEHVQALGTPANAANAANAAATTMNPTMSAAAAGATSTTAMPRTTTMTGAPPPNGNRPPLGPRRPVEYAQVGDDDGDRRGSWYAIAAFVALLVLVGGGILLFNQIRNDSDTSDTTPTTFPMPNVVGKTLEEATQILEAAQLQVNAQPETEPTTVAEGQVSRTLPAADAVVSPGETIALFYVPVSEPVPVPTVVGLTLDEAYAALQAAGFQVAPPNVVNDPDVEEGRVISTDPPEGTPAPKGSTVQITISGGPESLAVPPTQGFTEQDARNTLTAEPYAFNVTVTQEESDTVGAGQVIGTTPAAGELVKRGADVKIIISTGPATKTVPPLVGLTEDVARATLEQNGLRIEVTTQPVAEGSAQDGKVISQSPERGSKVDPGSVVKVRVGAGVPPTTPTTSPPTDPPVTDPPATTTPTTTPTTS
jgi:eukaryotic-like serine/threonine-protein kinase